MTTGRLNPRVQRQIEELGITIEAINGSDLPLRLASNRSVRVSQIQFEYTGPAGTLVFAWGLKPKTGLFGTSFGNGSRLIPGAWAFGAFPVAECLGWSSLVHAVNVGFVVPAPGSYALEGGGVGSISGNTDVWLWLADITGFIDQGTAITNDMITNEANILVIDTDGAVVEVAQGGFVGPEAQARGLDAFYEFG